MNPTHQVDNIGFDAMMRKIFDTLQDQQSKLKELEENRGLCIMTANKYAKTRNISIDLVLRFCHAENNGFPASRIGERNWQIDAHRADTWIRENLFQGDSEKTG